jgi:hypothetical protein
MGDPCAVIKRTPINRKAKLEHDPEKWKPVFPRERLPGGHARTKDNART